MKKRVISVLVLAALLLTLLAACGNKGFITAEQAQKIALKDLGIRASQADDIHTHAGTLADGTPIYNIHVTVQGVDYEYVIQANGGEIISANIGSGAH